MKPENSSKKFGPPDMSEEHLIAKLMLDVSNNTERRDESILRIMELLDPLISWFASRCKGNVDFEEMKSEAIAITLKAMSKFDDSRGASFKTFLTLHLRGMAAFRLKESLCISIPSSSRFVNEYLKSKYNDKEIVDAKKHQMVDRGKKIAAMEYALENDPRASKDKVEQEMLIKQIYNMSLKLSKKEREAIHSMFFSGKDLTKKDLIERIGTSRQNIDFHIRNGIKKLSRMVNRPGWGEDFASER